MSRTEFDSFKRSNFEPIKLIKSNKDFSNPGREWESRGIAEGTGPIDSWAQKSQGCYRLDWGAVKEPWSLTLTCR